MRQYQAVEKISAKAINDNLCLAIILKGSLARATEDEYSDVDLYLIVSEENYDKVLEKRLEYLSCYLSIMYHKFIHNQTVCVFDNGLRVDLYVTTLNKLSRIDKIAIVYDPNNLLENYKPVKLGLNPVEVGDVINSYCFSSLEFYSAYNRGDLVFCLRIASHLSEYLGAFLRSAFDDEYAKFGLKQFFSVIDEETKKKYLEIIKKMKVDTILISVQMMYVLIDGYINQLPLRIAEYVNFDFYLYTKKLIMSIER